MHLIALAELEPDLDPDPTINGMRKSKDQNWEANCLGKNAASNIKKISFWYGTVQF